MSIDEVIRIWGYTVLAPGLAYLGMVARNRGQTWWSWLAFTLSLFFFLLMVGLVLLRMGRPMPVLLHINTGVVLAMALIVLRQSLVYLRLWWVEWKMQREHDQLQRCTLGNG